MEDIYFLNIIVMNNYSQLDICKAFDISLTDSADWYHLYNYYIVFHFTRTEFIYLIWTTYFILNYIFLTQIRFCECCQYLFLVKNSCCVWWEFFSLNKFVIPNLSWMFFCVPDIKQTLKTVLWVQNHLLNLCSRVVNSQKLFCSHNLVRNVRIKDF